MKKDALGTVVLVAIVAICLYIWYRTSDFALALVLITAAFFAIWVVDRLAFARRRRERAAAEGQKPHEPVLVDYARSFFPMGVAVAGLAAPGAAFVGFAGVSGTGLGPAGVVAGAETGAGCWKV